MADKRQQVKQILFENDKTKKWLQDKLPHLDIYYLLSDNCKKFDVNDYDEIIKVLDSEGFVTSEEDRCKHLAETVLRIDALLGNSLDLLNSTVIQFIIDNDLSSREKKKICDLLDSIDLSFERRMEEAKRVLGIK